MHLLHAGKLFEMGLDIFVGHTLIERSKHCIYMLERRTYTLDAKDFKRIIDFVLYFQQGCSVADEDEEGPACQQEKGSAVNSISRWSAENEKSKLTWY